MTGRKAVSAPSIFKKKNPNGQFAHLDLLFSNQQGREQKRLTATGKCRGVCVGGWEGWVIN